MAKEAHAQHQKVQQTPKEVSEGLKASLDAIREMKKGNLDAAKKNLVMADMSFDAALKANPNLKMVPIASEVNVEELELSSVQINARVQLIKEALAKNQLQDARALMLPMRDEMRISVQYIPMQLYPKAAKMALDELNKGDKTKAIQTMVSALETMVSENTLIPIPLLEAQEKIEAAVNMEKSKKNDAANLIKGAKEELAKAVGLGYLSENSNEYKNLKSGIESVEYAIAGESSAVKLYDEVKVSFLAAIKKGQNESHKLMQELHGK